ncbi:ABC transporter ATP-binding protein [Xanthovirga aplysinae]|uniref:ABC transporter ATP-binding protein n=1 Tax=Xanthovirga aplysinae TaxID=2529853 RepID=UPI0012BC7735|nr:ABC transporter ATP-binding protein [Xanthovirga aplysinae]MTI31978.1 ABC transporter ATP-binding protein [Xanthovirga aplysinae]
MNFLELKKVSKTFSANKVATIRDVSFSLKNGEIFSLIGESGSGKSTLLRLIAGLEDVDEGEIFLEGVKVTGPAQNLVPGHSAIEIVNQDFELFEYLTISENIAHFIEFLDKTYRKQKVKELLEICRLSKYANNFPRELSGGERQRVALARALAKDPKLLLLDEPFSNLDVHLKNQLRFELREIIWQTGTTAIFVTHDTQDALVISEKIALLERGEITQMGTPHEIYNFPRSPYVASLFGEVNVVSGNELSVWAEEQTNSISVEKLFCIRPEHLVFDPSAKKIRGTILNKDYFGAYWQIEISVNENRTLLLNTGEQDLKIGDEIGIRLLPNSFHSFENE